MSTARTGACAPSSRLPLPARQRRKGRRWLRSISPRRGWSCTTRGCACLRDRPRPSRPSPIWRASRSRSAKAGRPIGACRATPACRRISIGRAPATWRASRFAIQRPSRLHEPGAETIGYKNSVLFPVEVVPKDARQPVDLALTLEFGVCREICIPAEAKFSLALRPSWHVGQSLTRGAGGVGARAAPGCEPPRRRPAAEERDGHPRGRRAASHDCGALRRATARAPTSSSRPRMGSTCPCQKDCRMPRPARRPMPTMAWSASRWIWRAGAMRGS